HNTKIYNADYFDESKFISLEEIFSNYSGYKEVLNDKNAEIWKEVRENIKKFNPDILGISMFTGAYKSAKITAQIAKEINPNLKTVVGGPHPTLCAEGTLKNEEFDYAVVGEGEFVFLDLASGKPLSDINGLVYKKGGKIIKNPEREFIADLDSLPFPARNLFLDKGENINFGNIATGRGCPYACRFCASPKIWKRKVRLRSADNVIKEIEEMISKYNQKSISFVDDTFTLIKNRAMEICRKIIDKKLNIEWRCDTRADHLDDELVDLMKKAGCVCIRLGVESGSDKVLKLMNKMATKDQLRKAANLVKKYGISLTVYLMAGFPGETDEDLKETIDFAKELEADYYSLGIVSPYYGTDIYFELKEKGQLTENEDWEYFFHQSMDGVGSKNLNPKLLEEFLSLNKTCGKGSRI
ncbi:MAG: radical SAM protein, partial [Candidatus Nealsonbacteria bacterium]|nr:radical SAM protein [Candidatus Nealsonbacteria bacterium]